MNKKNNINVLISLIAILSVLLLLEGFLRIYNRYDQRGVLRICDPRMHHKLRANVAIPVEWEKGKKIYYFTNSLGFRDAAKRRVSIIPDGKRIIFLGDSFTEGVGVPYENTFVSRLASLLGDKGIKVEILNGGVVSYSPILEYLQLKDLLRKGFKLDLAVLMLDISDVQDEVLYDKLLQDKNKPTLFSWHLYSLYNNSFLFRLFYSSLAMAKKSISSDKKIQGWSSAGSDYYRERDVFTENPDVFNRWGEKGLILLTRDIGRIKELLGSYGVDLIVVIYPWKTQIESKIQHSIYEKTVIDYCESKVIPVINLFTDFRRLPYWQNLFVNNDVHWSSAGHDFIARNLYRDLEKYKVIEKLKR